MAKGVFIHRTDSIYDDKPEQQYQFPKNYLSRASQYIGDWVIYYEPTKVGGKGYYAVAKVESIIPDPTSDDLHLALIEPGSYLPFENNVSFRIDNALVEQGLLNSEGKISGRAQSAIREISLTDFNRIFDMGFPDNAAPLPREGTIDISDHNNSLHDNRTPFIFEVEHNRVQMLGTRAFRERAFRTNILAAYDRRCAITGFQFINGGGRAEAEAAHIRPVEFGGPDSINNGIALSGTIHWMFDRGLISLSNEYDILVSHKVNDTESVWNLINKSKKALIPDSAHERPHPRFIEWHRQHHNFSV